MHVIRLLEEDSSCLCSERLAIPISDDEMSISDMADHVGSTPMHTISEHMASVPLELCGFLAVNLASLSVLHLSLGTGCSGIDVLVPSLLMLCASLCTKYRLPQLEWDQLWCCDIETGKRRWLRDVMQVPTIFTDMCEMPSGKAFCFAHQCMQTVNSVFAFSCGFSCQSVSSANTHRSDYHGCLANGTGKTGKTFRACMQLIALLLPILVWLENVSGLSAADRATVVAELEALGYCVVVVVSDLAQHGIPCRRVRVWFLACLMPFPMSAEHRQIMQEHAEAIEVELRRSPLSLSRFIMKPGDADFDFHAAAAQHKRGPHGLKTHAKWKVLHRRMWATHRRKGLAKPRLPAHCKDMFVRYSLTPREADACLLDIARHPKHYGSDQTIFFDVSQSANRMSHRCGVCPTILPTGKLVISHKQDVRLLFGVEALALQGIHWSMLPCAAATRAFNDRFFRHAAGNAFSGPQSQLAIMISLCVFELPLSDHEVDARRAHARFLQPAG
jgi:site-specific DNA-cytosine methylase